MAKNRKAERTSTWLAYLVPVVVGCALLGAVGVGYVWQHKQLELLGRQMKDLEQQLESLQTQGSLLDRALADLQSHRALEARVRELGLGLGLPHPDQILRLPEPAAEFPSRPGAHTVRVLAPLPSARHARN